MPEGEKRPRLTRRKRIVRIVQVVLSLAVVAVVFLYALPKIADYSSVGKTIASLTGLELLTLVAATAFNIFTYWPQMVASLPGLTLAQAAVNNQTSTTIANTVPGGGVVAIGVSYAMYRSWGFTDSAIGLSEVITFIWNTFLKLGLPIVALAILAIEGKASTGLLTGAVIGLIVLAVAIGLFAMMLWKKALARRIGAGLGAAATWLRKVVRKPPFREWGEAAVRFRKQTIRLVSARWVPLTVTTLVSHLGLYFVLLLALRHVGVSEREVSAAQVLGVFAVVRLLSALPITPGGLGIVELGYIGGLVLAGRHHADVPLPEFRAQVAAAVLVFRALTYGIQIPLGGVTYLIWQRKKSWRKAQPVKPLEPAVPGIAAVP